ncbi:MAG: HNH endonuclease [Planctomycetes bacterium]|nr:HNH endonuclease [Planctomycetota bacterium]
MADESREFVTLRAGGRCEYCQMHQSLQGATFHLEHIIPRILGGSSELSNLALACPSCNLHKADRTSGANPSNGEVIPFFNPRQDNWDTHFDWEDVTLIAKTEIGRVTIKALDLNHERRIRIRRAEQLFGLFPPDRTSE